MTPILMEEAYWRTSHFSVAKYYGGVKFGGTTYKIVNKKGITLEELSDPDSKHYVKDSMAIAPGEPADLVDVDFIPYYKKLGRDKFIEILERNHHTPREMLRRIYEEEAGKKNGNET